MDRKKRIYEEKVLEVLSENKQGKELETSPEFRERLRKSVIQTLHDPIVKNEEIDQFWKEIELHKKDDDEAYERYMSEIQGLERLASYNNSIKSSANKTKNELDDAAKAKFYTNKALGNSVTAKFNNIYRPIKNPFDEDDEDDNVAASPIPLDGCGYQYRQGLFGSSNLGKRLSILNNKRYVAARRKASFNPRVDYVLYQLKPDDGKPKTGKLKSQWKAILSLAAVFIFLICGTLLTRDYFHKTINNPDIHNGQINVIEDPGGASVDNLDIVDTSELINSDDQIGGISEFFQDMWLFIKASIPYIGGSSVLILIIVIIKKHGKSNK